MVKKMGYGIVIALLMTSVVLGYTVQVQPGKIVPNSKAGAADTIQVSVAISVSSVEDLVATISLGGGAAIYDIGFYYCAIDDILHIYFDKDTVIEQIEADGLDGAVDVYLECTFLSDEGPVEITGYDTIEVFNAPTK